MQVEVQNRKKVDSGKKQGKERSSGGARRGRRVSFRLKLKAVKLHLEEGFKAPQIAKQIKVHKQTVYHWVSLYKKFGEDALRPTRPLKRKRGKASGPVKEKIVEVKKENPQFGARRISDTLRRIFFLKASPETVRKTLKDENLTTPQKRKPKKNPQKPRFFERATPNQLWQSDIFTFRLGGKYAYLIGFMDDYSRYITAMDLFRSQTADNVISLYRIACGEYHPPKEMLTDNGRQYTNWRGVTKFEKELKKDRVKHLKSRPHHPMTLGKIERFWKSIFTEFLSRAQFDSFESAQNRIRLWIKYYNHKRPHQGIGGLCPADRFFEIQSTLRKTIENGIQDNVLEMALRGKPQSPFYMVGRMGDQSVVIRAEKGKVKMLLDGKEEEKNREIEYHVDGGDGHGGKEKQATQESQTRPDSSPGSLPGRAVGMVGMPQALGDLSIAEHSMEPASQLGATCSGGDAQSISPPEETSPGPGAESSPQSSPEIQRKERGIGEPFGEASCQDSGIEVWQGGGDSPFPDGEERLGGDRDEGEGDSPKEGGGDSEGAGGPDDGQAGSENTEGIEENVLRMGESGFGGDDGSASESPDGTAAEIKGPGEGEAAEEADQPREGASFLGASDGAAAAAGRMAEP